MKYRCQCCGELHDTWPAIAFKAPNNYIHLTNTEKKNIAKLSSDFCVIEYPDQTDYFIRVTMTQKVLDDCQDLSYGVWVSLSEESFADYQDNYENDEYITSYFGWLCSFIPGYENTLNIPTTVQTKDDNQRPEIVPRKKHNHQFVRDYYAGITKEEAERRIDEMLRHTGAYN